MRSIGRGVGAVFGLLLLCTVTLPAAVAQSTPPPAVPKVPAQSADPPPPEVGAAVIEDPFSEPEAVRPFDCATGRGGFHYVGEGLRLRLSGRCHDSHPFAITGPLLRGLSVADGEVRIEVKAVDGLDRVRFTIQVRRQPGAGVNREAMAAGIEPGRRRAFIGTASGAETGYLAERTDLADTLAPDDWNSLAFRLRGPELWLLVNDQPVLYTSGGSLDRGEVILALLRIGGGPLGTDDDPSDSVEAVAVSRNLSVSPLAADDPARAPTYERP